MDQLVAQEKQAIEVRYRAAMAWLEEMGSAYPHERAKEYALLGVR
jgi:hypothetical protein